MEIYYYQRPTGDKLIVENESVYKYMETNNIEEFSFGVLLSINDYDWHNDYGNGYLMKVYEDYEEAKKRKVVYPCDPDDIESAHTDLPVKISIQKQDEPYKIKIVVDDYNEPIFDILHPNDINLHIPKKYRL